tara:strand:- start:9019 stop:9777 length:759 start_codon:yes stop_codon:yes gene_type:complete
MNKVISTNFHKYQSKLDQFIYEFHLRGKQFGEPSRNTIKLFDLSGVKVNIKAFKVPVIINRLIYGTLRKSKARRSYEFAKYLGSLGIKSPTPIAYYESSRLGLFGKSYYISEHLDYDLTFRELTTNLKHPHHEIILRAFTRFTYNLHQNHINFLDHSPGNTLIVKNGSNYDFYLVDLNRMEFMDITFEKRVANFAKLTTHQSLIEVMSDEYSKCTGKPYDYIFDIMWKSTCDFQYKYHKKKMIKKRLLFWKK